MDSVGRLVVPKALRAELGITGPAELEVIVRDRVIELTGRGRMHRQRLTAGP